MTQKKKINRRQFLSGTAAALGAFTIVPRYVLGGRGYTPPSEKLNVAGIGIGGVGKGNLARAAGLKKDKTGEFKIEDADGENIVALCDVDEEYAGKVFERHPGAKKYRDYRRMLEKQRDIDAVIIATPDHTHAVIAMMAMEMGKHVYLQKPLTHSVYEARKLTEAARRYKVATQMGNQGHSGEGIRLIKEWIRDGAIGPVREVHCWTNRPVGWWPQGVSRPEETSPVPSTLDWDLWLGPAPFRPYNPIYLPFKWRGRWDFGTGVLGDMGCHIMDVPFWALELGYPISVEASSTNAICSEDIKSESAPLASIVRYRFPARSGMPAVKLNWYDGGLMPARPGELEEGRRMGNKDGGCLFIGDKGKIMCGCYGKSPRLIPEAKMEEYKKRLPKKSIGRIVGSHEEDWIRACKGDKEACSNFDYAGPLTEAVLVGNIAIRSGKKLDWDGENMKVTNVDEANKYINRPYREGWSL